MHVLLRIFLLSCLLFPLSGCAAQPTMEATATPIPPTQRTDIVTITGWFTTIWNGGARYSITDDEGQTTRLLLDEELAKPLGGPLALDRKRVVVSGRIVDDPPGALQVLSIRFEEGQ